MNEAAEKNVIGAVLMDNKALQSIYGKLNPEMFGVALHREIYRSMLYLYDNNSKIDIASITAHLGYSAELNKKVLSLIAECASQTLTSAFVSKDADIIIADYKVSQLHALTASITRNARGENIDSVLGELIANAENIIGSRESKTVMSAASLVEKYQDCYFTDKPDSGLKTGFSKLDNALVSLEGGDIIVIAARPSVGKSLMALQIACYMASQGTKVGYYNLEMNDTQIYERMVSMNSGIGVTRLRKAKSFLRDEKNRFIEANQNITKLNLMIFSGSNTPVNIIKSETRHMGLDCLIIDYLQLMTVDGRYGSRREEVGMISRTMKSIAMDLNIPVIVLSQLNRLSEGREDKEPTMSELRESGDIEQDASVIIMAWNLDEDENGNAIHKGCKIEKGRQTSKVKEVLKFDVDSMSLIETDLKIADVVKGRAAASKSKSSPFSRPQQPPKQATKVDKDGFMVVGEQEEMPFM